MSETKHTPGPWLIESGKNQLTMIYVKEPIYGKTPICEISWRIEGDNDEAANAELIAAAPELLAVLTEMYTRFKNAGFGASGHYKDTMLKAKEVLKKVGTGE